MSQRPVYRGVEAYAHAEEPTPHGTFAGIATTFLWGASPASAHATLERTTPAYGVVLFIKLGLFGTMLVLAALNSSLKISVRMSVAQPS